jgi:hypothetical protein
VVVAATVLVVSVDQQCGGPLGARRNRAVGVEDQLLTESDVVVGVLAVARRVPAGLDESECGHVAVAASF